MINNRKLVDFLNKYAEQDFQLPERTSPYNDLGVDGYQFGFADGMTELARSIVALIDDGHFNYAHGTSGSSTSVLKGLLTSTGTDSKVIVQSTEE